MSDPTLEPAPAREVALRILRALDEAAVGHRVEPALAGAPLAARGPADGPFRLTVFQSHAVSRARVIMERYGGVVVADSVGLGKTYIGLELIREAVELGESVVVTTPASLRRTWSPGLKALRGEADRLRWLSHTRLGLGRFDPDLRPELLVVDEAHAFRTPGTRRYGALARLSEDARVMLLTATPVNNGVEDLYHLVRLFAADDAFRHVGIASLRECFRHAAADRATEEAGTRPEAGAGSEADQASGVDDGVRRVVRELVIRRTRSIVAGWRGASSVPAPNGLSAPPTLRFPGRASPRVVTYGPGPPAEVVSLIGEMELSPYGAGVGELVRLGLLKRLESGRAAFRATLRRQRRFFQVAREAAGEGRLARSADIASLIGRASADRDATQLILTELLLEPAPPDTELESVISALGRDLGRIRRIAALLTGTDPKVDSLVREVGRLAPGERAIVFTEFRDTAESLWRALLRAGTRVGRVDGGGAWLGEARAGRREVIDRFAPRANGRPEPPAREGVDVLVATDVLAEGLNLQDARHVICYDLPWNPVRILQRLGRVDRLGSPHDEVVPHLFLPDDGLDDVLRLTRRIRRKLRGIAGSVGAEQADALLDHLGGLSPDRIGAALEETERTGEDPRERLLALAAEARPAEARRRPGIHHPLSDSESRDRVPVAHLGAVGGAGGVRWIVALRCHEAVRIMELDRQGRVVGEAGPASVAILSAARVEPRADAGCSDGSPSEAEAGADSAAMAAVSAALGHLRSIEAEGAAPGRLAPGSLEARLARRVHKVLQTAGSLPSPDLLKLAGQVLARLEAPTSPGVARDLARLDAMPRADSDPDTWLATLHVCLSASEPPRAQRLAGSGTEVVGVLEVGP